MKIDFETINELKAARRKAGQLERTKGKNSVNDGLGGIYLIQTPAQFGGTPDEINDFAIANNNIARFLKANVQINNTEAQVRGANDGFIDLSPRIPRITDGRLDFWQDTSQTSSGYGSDIMWRNTNVGSTKVHTQETLTIGVDVPDIPTAQFYSRTVVTSVPGNSNGVNKSHRIESVRSYAGQTIVVQFRARADTNKQIAISLRQNFGSGGGSSEVKGIGAQKINITTTFNRYTAIFNVPSIAGKTIGSGENDYLDVIFWFDAGSDFDSETDSLGQQSGTFDLACIQDDIGTEAKPFYEYGPQESLDRVERYYYEIKPDLSNSGIANGRQRTQSDSIFVIYYGKEMRAVPDTTFSAANTFEVDVNAQSHEGINIFTNKPNNSTKSATIDFTGSPNLSTDSGGATLSVKSTDAFIRFDARL